MSDVTIKDTKQVIYDALTNAEKTIKELRAGKSNPVEEAKKAETKKAVESAAVSVKEGIFSDDLNKKYEDVMTAIQVGEDRIKELYGIDKELITLTTIVNAHKDEMTAMAVEKDEKEKELDEYFSAMRARLNDEIDSFRKAIADEKEMLRKDLAAYKAQLKIDRAREAEEYEYSIARQHDKENDAWEDEKAAREVNITAKEDAAQKLLSEANAKADYITELEVKVAAIPSLIDEAKIIGATEKEKELGREYGYKKSMAEKEHEFEVSRLTDKLSASDAENLKKDAKIATLEEKLDDAYSKIEALAGRTVEAAGGVKIIGSTNGNQSK